jgi:glycerol kinase
MAKYVGAIDQGTTRTRFMIFDHDGREVARHQLEHEQIRPAAGRLEHDPHEIWETTSCVVSQISCGSCSSRPTAGRICSCSSW